MHTRREEPIFKQLGDSFSVVAKIFFPNYEKSIIFVGCNKKKTCSRMMKLFTQVDMPASSPTLTYGDKAMMLGSCFADRLGSRLVNAKFRCDVNPYGTLYNPLSISRALREILAGKVYSAQDLFFYNGCWHSAMHHGDFSSPQQAETLRLINERISWASQNIRSLKHLFITFGTAWVYEAEGCVVSNCHKRQESDFERRRLEVEEIVDDYEKLLNIMLEESTDMEVTFTVSPIRHVRDGLHENQLSKATLLLAIDKLQKLLGIERVHYFPAYELMMDEWRDYRYYAADMAHPSEVAEQLMWERFTEHCMSRETQGQVKEVEGIVRMLNHRPLHADAETYKEFLKKLIKKIDQLTEKYPQLDFKEERKECLTKLEK